MGRRRLKPKGEVVYHHVMTRTAQQVFWLEEPEVKDIFVDLIDFYSKVYYVEILGHVCMSNHVHLCLAVHRPDLDLEDVRRRHELAQARLTNPRPFREELADHYYERYTDLSMFMWEINRLTALIYNKRKDTKGHFWGAPFKNVVVEDGQSLLNVLAYIELNPVRAGLVEDPADFRHSSVGRLREALDRGAEPSAPNIKALQGMPEEMRAPIYLDWIRFVALAAKDPGIQRQGLPMKLTPLGRVVDMKAVYEALETRAPASWSRPIYGPEAFTRKTLMEVGLRIPISTREADPIRGHRGGCLSPTPKSGRTTHKFCPKSARKLLSPDQSCGANPIRPVSGQLALLEQGSPPRMPGFPDFRRTQKRNYQQKSNKTNFLQVGGTFFLRIDPRSSEFP